MPRVIHFDLPADEPERAFTFYGSVFGWQFQKWDGPVEYCLIDTGTGEPGINGGLLRRPSPEHVTTNTIGVESLDDTVAKVEASGGKVVMPRMAVPGVGFMAYCADTEGNIFGLWETASAPTRPVR